MPIWSHKVLLQFCADNNAEAIYKPILLGGVFKATDNRAPMIRYADAPAKLAYEQLEFKRFLEVTPVESIPYESVFPSQLAAGYAGDSRRTGQRGCLLPAVDALMRGMWENGLDLATTRCRHFCA